MYREFLKEIVEYKKEKNIEKKDYYAAIINQLNKNSYSRYGLFKKAISVAGKINLIAEIKKASPSKGLIREDFDCLRIAKIYCENDVAAISVLTEDKFFKGGCHYLKKVADNVNVPVLAKDFFIDVGQIYEARINGASAILLIMSILTDLQVKEFIAVADFLDLDCLVETHDQEEVQRALKCGAEIIGINNRNLETFEVDLNTSVNLMPLIPKDKVIVAESGISNYSQVIQLKNAGANAVLIGETFMREKDIAVKIKEVMG